MTTGDARASPVEARPADRSIWSRSLEWTGRDSAILVALLVVAGLLRFIRLSEPGAVIFDETYYAKDACLYTGEGQEFCGSEHATEISWVHPPLGKWLIAAGIRVFGYNAFGWRFSSALFGTALVGLVYLLARRLFRDRWVAGVAGLLVATDFLLIVQSRVAMLDIFMAFFVVLGFLFLSLDRDRIMLLREHARLPFPGAVPRRMPEWRLLAGAAFGAGIATKWQSGLAIIVAALIGFSWSTGLMRMGALAPNENDQSHPFRRELGVIAAAFLVIPVLIYLASYGLWFKDNYPRKCTEGQTQRLFLTNKQVGCREGISGTVLAFGELQDSMLDFHTKLEAKHPYASPARTWPLVLRPVAYYYEGNPKSAHILAFGNPATWWAALAAAVWLIVRSLRPWKPERFVLAAWAGQYLPWLGSISRPAIFIFYMTPIVPFMMLGLAGALGAIRDMGKAGRWVVMAYLAFGVGVLLWYFYPIIAAVGLPYDWWYDRMWLRGRWI